MSEHRSPVSPGLSWYEDGLERPRYDPLEGDSRTDVCIVGGGFTGLACALHLAERGTDVVLLEASRVGDGASGRNGGQMGTGPRDDMEELESEFGEDRARALWNIAAAAKRNLLATAERYQFGIDYRPGQMTAIHKRRYAPWAKKKVERLRERYGYGEIEWVEPDDMAVRLGSRFYHGGVRDSGTGHIHPMKYVVGLAKAAAQQGARICEGSAATRIREGPLRVETAHGTVQADKVLLALNGVHGDLHPEIASHVLPIQSFIGSTPPLDDALGVLPGGEAVDDTRFMVRYFRKTGDKRLLFGGREAYGKATPADIRRQIGRQIAEVYPQLAGIPLTHAWGGSVGITPNRRPFVRELAPGLWTAGAYAGHGVMLSNETGRLVAERFLGGGDAIERLRDIDVPPFPGGRHLREPLKVAALTWFALLDRF